jgi:hypothetical protein
MSITYINLPPDIQGQITSYAQQYSVDSLVASAIAQVLSGGQQFYSDNSLVVTPYGVGVMGISTTNANGFDVTETNSNIEAGISYLALLLQTFTGNYPLALAAYITSALTVQTANGVPQIAPIQNFVYQVSTLAAQAGSYSVSGLYAIRNQASTDPTAAASQAGNIIDPATTGINYGSASGVNLTGEQLNTLQNSVNPQLQVDDPTLSATAWYADTGLVTGNPRIRASVQPVSFIVYLDRNDPTQVLSVPNVNNQSPGSAQPIQIQLNTSLATFEITSKHVFNRTPSRTGMHITLWGMQPDLINGTGSTGVFMNQFGLTDFMSTAGLPDDALQLVTQGFSTSFQPNTSTSGPSVAFVNTVTGSANSGTQAINAQDFNNPQETFRVAAQDAFVEFLKLFQMNGNIWYTTQSYANGKNAGTMSQTEQMQPNAWSSKTGASSFQQHSRNNDVMSRGYVSMRYRNNVYLGYFKSLTWTQDAESPFQWKFSFTFQVEKTYTSIYNPNPQVTMTQTATQTLS